MFKYITLFMVLIGSAHANSLQQDVIIFQNEINTINDSLNFATTDDVFDDKYSKIQSLKAAVLQRKRVIQNQRAIVVNVVEQRMRVYDKGTVVIDQKVIIGRKDRPTPLFNDKLTHVVVNPYWNVPISLSRKDVIPKIKKDPSSVKRSGYELVSYKTNSVVQIKNSNINLKKYRIRQRPGPRNSLGVVKFMFPYNENRRIFLHDTNAKHLFAKENRRYSSGCIRLERPMELAAFLLNKTESYIKNTMTGAERWAKIKNPIDVYVVSWDTYINDSGIIVYRDI